jgi:hypothetical protein
MIVSSSGGKPRLRRFERNVELELMPLELRDRIGLTLVFASLCVVSCGGVLFFGSAWWHVHGETGYIGLALILGGSAVFALVLWLLEPHKAVKHASHRLRHHARKLRAGHAETGPGMTDAEVDAIEDAFDR